MSGENPLPKGRATFCEECDKPIRVQARLPYAESVNLCPQHFEQQMNGEL